MRFARLAICALILTGCATVAPAATTGPSVPLPTPIVIYVTPPATPVAVVTPSPAPTSPPVAQQTATAAPTVSPIALAGLPQGCLDLLMPFYNKLDELDTRLGVGLNFSDYASQVSDLAVAAKPITADAVSAFGVPCAQVGVH